MRGGQFLHWMKYHLGLEPAATQTTDAERAAIRAYAEGRLCLVEIGVFEGVTSLVLRESMDPAGTLFCVDPFFKGALGVSYGFSISRREIGKSRNGSVQFLQMLSHDAARKWQAPVENGTQIRQSGAGVPPAFLRQYGSRDGRPTSENGLILVPFAPVDFIFFDGNHSDAGVRGDWADWSPHIVAGGVAAFHDSVDPEATSGPPELVREICEGDGAFELVLQVDSISVFRRR